MYEFQDGDVICSCTHITKKQFVSRIQADNIDSLDQARELTRVNVACGMCITIVEKLLAENPPAQ